MNTDMKALFETKENYIKFRKQWATSANNPSFTKDKDRHPQYLDGSMHLLYKILRNKKITHGYTRATTRKAFVGTEHLPYNVIERHVNMLRYYLAAAIRNPKNSKIKDVFGDTVTTDMLREVYKYLESIYVDVHRLT